MPNLKEIHTFCFYSFSTAQIVQNTQDIALRLHCNAAGATASLRTASKNNLKTNKKFLPAH